MFEAALDKVDVERGRLGTGALLSVTAHVVVVGLLLVHPTTQREAPPEAPEVKLMISAGPPGGGGPAPRAPAGAPPEVARREPRKRRAEIVLAPKQEARRAEEAKAPELDPGAEPAEGATGSGEGGTPGGGGDGPPGGGGLGGPGGPGSGIAQPAPPPAPTTVTLPFLSGMERPVLISGSQPVYPRQALMEKVEGLVLVKCVITTAGTLRSCRILKGLPYMDGPVLEALGHYRYKPVQYEGRPVNLEYVIPIKFTLQ